MHDGLKRSLSLGSVQDSHPAIEQRQALRVALLEDIFWLKDESLALATKARQNVD